MKIFLSWSGSRSKKIAEVLNEWLPKLILTADPWMSPDIEKGNRWSPEIARELEDSRVGIICLTKENLDSRWILYESGALSKTGDSHVCTLLLDITPEDVEQPLAQFQHTQFEKEDIRKLMYTINQRIKNVGERFHSKEHFDEIFDVFWPDLERKLQKIVRMNANETPKSTEIEYVAEFHHRPLASQCSVNLLDRGDRIKELGFPTNRIRNAKKEVWMTGTTLNTATGGQWRGFEDTDAKIKAILPDFTEDSIVRATAITDNRYETGLEDQKNYMFTSWKVLNSLKTRAGRIEVKLLPYSPCYSIFAVDADHKHKEEGSISVEIIGYHYKPGLVPAFVLCKNNSEHRKFYDLYLSMWNEMWEDAFFYGDSDENSNK
ncbi:MAG: toll/interleukin-1 receptor domain-containing protein [Theionarchaea archaeon]|nr:toll/interleukin-1 receptor domain-containing protein [Theionarchaea archaeon]